MINWSDGFPMTAGPRIIGVSEAAPETQGYFDALAEERLAIKQCPHCTRHHHPRRIACPDCGTTDLVWVDTPGDATVYSFSVIHRAPVPEMESAVPYALGIVELAEGVHMFTRLFTAPNAELTIGQAARLEFRKLEQGDTLPVWVVGG